MTIRALVFDLAGVLLDFGGPESLHRLSHGRIGDEEFFRFWSEATCAHDFHCGRCTPEQFAWHDCADRIREHSNYSKDCGRNIAWRASNA